MVTVVFHLVSEVKYTATHAGGAVEFHKQGSIFILAEDRTFYTHQAVSKMALSSVLGSDYAEFSLDSRQRFSNDCPPSNDGVGFDATPGDGLNFSVKKTLGTLDEDGVERKIEFLHGTTTLAFKVSSSIFHVIFKGMGI